MVITDGNGTVVSVKKLEEVTETPAEDKTEKSRKKRDSDTYGQAVENQENKIESVSSAHPIYCTLMSLHSLLKRNHQLM